MKLKQEDRELFRIFFCQKREWIMNNSLNIADNLIILKQEFIKYMADTKQNENNSFMIFILMLDQEIIESKKRLLEKKYNTKNGNKLNWRPVCPPLTDNKQILSWIKESNISYEVSKIDMDELGYSIKQKIKQNENERIMSWENSKNKLVK